MSITRHTRYPYQRTRTYFTMSGEVDRQQGAVASEAAAAPAKDIVEETETAVPRGLSIHIFSVMGK